MFMFEIVMLSEFQHRIAAGTSCRGLNGCHRPGRSRTIGRLKDTVPVRTRGVHHASLHRFTRSLRGRLLDRSLGGLYVGRGETDCRREKRLAVKLEHQPTR